MEKLSHKAIERLVNEDTTPAVTIYIPMHTTASPPHLSENQIRFKNLLHKAASRLGKHGAEHDLAQQLQATEERYRDDLEFWENQTPALLICASPAGITMLQLPIDTEEYVAVDEQYHLAPVLGLISDAKDFYVLTLAQQNPKLYRGNTFGLEPTDIALPINIAAALNIDENNQKSENQGTATGPSSNGGGWFNGRGGARNPQEEDRLRFFRMIDHMITEKADRALPLILAGIDAEVAEYRSLSKYPKLLEGWIAGNRTETTRPQLFESAMEIVRKELIAPEHEAALEEYKRLEGTNPQRVASSSQSVTTAAEQGRVDKLLAALYRSTSDTVRDTLQDVLRITFPDAATSKTLNKVATMVWQMSGKIVSVFPEQIPNHAPMVARLRY